MFSDTPFSGAPFSSLSGVGVVVAVTGVSATGAVGTASAIVISGVSATGQVGTVSVSVTANPIVPVTGVSATGQVGQVIIPTVATVTGVSAIGYTYTPQVWGAISTVADPNWTIIAA